MALSDFIRAPSKKSLLAMLKKADKLTPRLLDKLFEGVLFKSELKGFESGGGVDHGALSGLSDDDHTQYLRTDGSRALTSNWDAGSFEIRAQTLESDVATGTAPLTIASTTLVTNLNADKLDGYDEADFDYDLISGNDGDTNVTGAELEELSDGSDTTLHGHDVTGLTNWNGEYLPLTAGISYPLSGSVYLDGVLYQKDSNGDWRFSLDQSGVSQLLYVGSTATDLEFRYDADATFSGGDLSVTSGDLYVGNGTNEVQIRADEGIYLVGTATMWDDLRVAADATKLQGSKDPDYAVFKTNGSGSQGVFTYWFDDGTEEEVYFSIQMPHSWAEGTDIEPHVHWVAATTAGGAGTDVCWGLEYTWANINGTFGNTTIIYADEQTNGATETITAGKHYLTDFSAISGSGKTMSSMLICRLFRDAGGTGGTDDLVGDAGLLEFDVHYQINSFGSKEEYVKGP